MLNISFNHFYCKIRKSFCTGEETPGYYDAIVVGAQSRPGYALTFHVITEIGGMRSRVPLHALCWKECDSKELSELCLWDCFGEHVTCNSFDYLQQSRVEVLLRSGDKQWGEYMMSFDWFDNGFSNEPSQYKIMHLIKLDSGHYALQPNNRLRWHDSSFITDEDTLEELKTWKVDQESFSAEMGYRWAIKGDEFFYSTNEESK